MKTASEIREAFLQYFEARGHQRVKSSSLVPENDPTLLFTNAGMNQFKDVFLGIEKRDCSRATSSQKCMRVSGKHNDLEAVGRTARHHTFFEMLGNFSFGDYFKKETIEFAWELCTSVYKLSPERLYVTIYEQDTEALALWRDHMGIPESRISKLGEKDNFWVMGETGPCGPCSELHYDLGVSPSGHLECGPECECGRYVEIWNLVFTQFNRDASGKMTQLVSPSIDTGMGLERIASVVQNVPSNYDTDLFQPILQEASRLTGTTYGQDEEKDVSLRILADHCRACAFLLNDGVIPGNEGRGYVLRKILRRAIRHGRMLGREEPFFYTLTALVAELMKEPYLELTRTRDYAAKVVKSEEEKFAETLTHGMRVLDEICEMATRQDQLRLPGKELFRLYDTYGFPLDLAREIAQERNFEVDESGFYEEMEKQRSRARASWKGTEKAVKEIYQQLAGRGLETEFTGNTEITDVSGQVLALLQEDREVSSLEAGKKGEVVLNRSPFYSEAGGQVSDQGTLSNERVDVEVQDVYSPVTGLRLHKVWVNLGLLKKGDHVRSTVLAEQRRSTARNHTATHLLHAALRQVLGEHVKQAGSLVAPDRLRFDVTHYRPLTFPEIREIEELVNQNIRDNIEIQTQICELDEALAKGAIALFGEKYQQQVRVVQVRDFSMELCGGTHVARTGDIALFKIVNEGGIASGVRRLEALTGDAALARFLEAETLLQELSEDLRVGRDKLTGTVEKLARELKEANSRMEELRLRMATRESSDAGHAVREIKGVRVIALKVEDLDRSGLRALADQLKAKLESGVVVLGLPTEGKVSLVAMVTPDLTHKIKADELLRKVAVLVDGGGGGRAEMAEAGGRDASKLDEALEKTYRFVAECLA